MAQITGGTVSVEDCKKHDGYPDPQFAPTRKVRVELTFANADGEDGGLDDASAKATAKVTQLLGGKPKAATVPHAAAPAPVVQEGLTDPKAEYARKVAAGEPIKGKPGRPPKAAVDPQAPVADPILDGPVADKPASDGLDDLMAPTPEPEKPITDADLNSAVTKKNAVLKNGGKIRDLIATFAPEGQKITLAQLPAAKRKEFLTKLDALS